jgi:hypothetical protein
MVQERGQAPRDPKFSWEFSVGHPKEREFAGTHGCGTWEVPADWPEAKYSAGAEKTVGKDDGLGSGLRGGFLGDMPFNLRLSDCSKAAFTAREVSFSFQSRADQNGSSLASLLHVDYRSENKSPILESGWAQRPFERINMLRVSVAQSSLARFAAAVTAVVVLLVVSTSLYAQVNSAGAFNLKLLNNHQPDFSDAKSFGRSCAYGWSTDQDRAISMWKWTCLSRVQTDVGIGEFFEKPANPVPETDFIAYLNSIGRRTE